MTNDYNELLNLWVAVADARKKAVEASRSWETLANEVAKEVKGLEGYGEVRFEKTRFMVKCRGTGIYSHQEWWEEFPVELLLNKMSQTQEGRQAP